MLCPQNTSHCLRLWSLFCLQALFVEQPSTPPHLGCFACPELQWVWFPLLNFYRTSICHSKVSVLPITTSTSAFFLYFIFLNMAGGKTNAYIIVEIYFNWNTYRIQNFLLFKLTRFFFCMWSNFIACYRISCSYLFYHAPSGYRHHRMTGKE